MKTLPRLVLSVVPLAIGACGTLYQASTPERPALPASFYHAQMLAHNEKGTASVAPLDSWWKALREPNLDALIEAVLKRNNTLAAAALHLKAAALRVHLAVTNPTIAGSVGYAGAKPLYGNAPMSQTETLAGTVSYDLDLSGTLAATRDAAAWEARATTQDRNGIANALVAASVNDYFQIAALNELMSMNEQDLASARELLSLTQVLKEAGGATLLDVAQARQVVDAQVANHASLQQQRVEARHALGELLDDEDWPESRERLVISDDSPPAVEAGLPAAVLERRPDLSAAQLRLRESLATVEETRRSFYPDLSLTAGVGTSSTALHDLLANPIGTLAATLALPFLQMDRALFATEAARLDYQTAAVTFRQTLRQALIDVDNALSARTQYQIEIDSQERSLQDATTAEDLNAVLFHAGSVPLQSWLESQASRRAAAEALVSTRLLAMQNYSTLCMALGGGPRAGLGGIGNDQQGSIW